MKTPREILLARHRGAEPTLDAVRKNAVKTITSSRPEVTKRSLSSMLWMVCRELILPARHIWTGLAACWALIFVLHIATRETSPAVAKAAPQPTPEMMAALGPQRQLFVELLSGEAKQNDADQPRRSRPMPHSEICRPYVIA